jgi:hypothetical protein
VCLLRLCWLFHLLLFYVCFRSIGLVCLCACVREATRMHTLALCAPVVCIGIDLGLLCLGWLRRSSFLDGPSRVHPSFDHPRLEVMSCIMPSCWRRWRGYKPPIMYLLCHADCCAPLWCGGLYYVRLFILLCSWCSGLIVGGDVDPLVPF